VPEGEPGDLVAAVRADPVLAPFAEALVSYARPSIRLRPDPDAERYLGESRVGGQPSVPVGFRWPTRHVDMPTPSRAWVAAQYFEPRLLPADGQSAFEFIAQVDLAAVAPFDVDRLLPSDGTLLFFYDDFYQSDIDPNASLQPTSWSLRDGQPEFYLREFGYDLVDQVRVIHLAAGLTLRLSDDGPSAPDALPLVASQEITLPTGDTYVIAATSAPDEETEGRVVLPPDAWERLAGLEYEHRANLDIDQMLGWADVWSHGQGLSPEIGGWASIPVADRLREALDVRLLLQLSPGTYEPTGIRFGRTLYFYIRESDLRRGDFSRAWYDSD
jgi:uncharacterized protein YwqG